MFMTPDEGAFTPQPQPPTTRPLERVEIDSYRVDLAMLIAVSGPSLSAKELRRLGLDGGKEEWFVHVAMCETTRCILAMHLSRTSTAPSTVQLMEMITRDKGVWAGAVGALSSWHMCGVPETLVTDCSRDAATMNARAAARDLGIAVQYSRSVQPCMRTSTERLFTTLAINMRPNLSGRSRDAGIKKNNDEPEQSTSTEHDLCAAVVRCAVDIYHSQPHAGLAGETPAQCWDRLTAR